MASAQLMNGIESLIEDHQQVIINENKAYKKEVGALRMELALERQIAKDNEKKWKRREAKLKKDSKLKQYKIEQLEAECDKYLMVIGDKSQLIIELTGSGTARAREYFDGNTRNVSRIELLKSRNCGLELRVEDLQKALDLTERFNEKNKNEKRKYQQENEELRNKLKDVKDKYEELYVETFHGSEDDDLNDIDSSVIVAALSGGYDNESGEDNESEEDLRTILGKKNRKRKLSQCNNGNDRNNINGNNHNKRIKREPKDCIDLTH